MWIIPSYNRVTQCRALLDNMRSHGAVGKTALVINEDDPRRAEYESFGELMLYLPAGTKGSSQSFNIALSHFPDEPWYGIICDDNIVRTDCFEGEMVRAAGSWGIASANDLWQAHADIDISQMTGAVVFGGEFIRALGYWAPPSFIHHYGIDDAWITIGRELGNWRSLMDVIVEHDHPFKTGSDVDGTLARLNSSDQRKAAVDQLEQWRSEEAGADIHRVRMAMWKAQGLSLDLARSRTVMLGFPVYERPSPQHEASAMDTAYLLAQLGIQCAHAHAIGKPIHEARNSIADAFLKSGMSDLVMIDSDMSWKAWDVVRLLATRHTVVAGVGRKRNDLSDSDPEAWCFNPISPTNIPCDQAGMAEVAQVGTGFMRINVRVFERLRDAHPEWRRRKNVEGTDHYTAFFRWTSDDEDDISEDIQFCRDYRALGGKIHIDPSIELGHYGTRNHKGRVSVLFT